MRVQKGNTIRVRFFIFRESATQIFNEDLASCYDLSLSLSHDWDKKISIPITVFQLQKM